jgi:hypothetical protein
VTTNWDNDIARIADNNDIDIAVLNSTPPFFIKIVWIVKANIPARLNSSENIRPAKER